MSAVDKAKMQCLTLFAQFLAVIITVNGAQAVSHCVVYRNRSFQTWITADESSGTNALEVCHQMCLHLSAGCAAALFNKNTVRPNPY